MTLVKFKNRPVERPYNSFVDDFFNGFPTLLKDDFFTSSVKHIAPVNVKETDGGFQLEVVAPGFNKEDFKINLEANLLTISAEHKVEEQKETEKYLRKEFKQQSFKRSFTVDENINTENINAQYVNGVLTLNLPKKATVKEEAKQITIQ